MRPSSVSPCAAAPRPLGAWLLAALVSTLACGPDAGAQSTPPQDSGSALPEGPPSELGGAEAEPGPTSAVGGTSAPRPENTIYRSELMRATKGGRPAYLLGQLSPEPYRPRGPREGWIITRVFPGDPELCAPGCDLFPGDIVLTVNGSPLERPEQLSALIDQLETMQQLDVRLVRDGKLHERSYTIVDAPAG